MIFLNSCTTTHSFRLAHRPPTESTSSCSVLAHPGTHSVLPIARPQAVRDLSRYLHIQVLTPSHPSPADRKYVILLDGCTSRHSRRLAHRPPTGCSRSCSIAAEPRTNSDLFDNYRTGMILYLLFPAHRMYVISLHGFDPCVDSVYLQSATADLP